MERRGDVPGALEGGQAWPALCPPQKDFLELPTLEVSLSQSTTARFAILDCGPAYGEEKRGREATLPLGSGRHQHIQHGLIPVPGNKGSLPKKAEANPIPLRLDLARGMTAGGLPLGVEP